MTPKRPPAVAVWLLKHFGCGPNTDAILGDLAERYVHKSTLWYWRQVLQGIPISIVTEALGHKLIAAKAIVTGFLVWFVFVGVYPNFVFGSPDGPRPSFDLYSALVDAPPFIGVWAALWSPVAGPLISPSDSPALQLWTQFVLPFLAWTVCGWIVTRVNIGYARRDLAPLFAGVILAVHLVLTIPGLTGFLAEVRRNPAGPNGVPFSIDAADLIAPTVANIAISVFGILLGGSLRRTRGADMTPLVSSR
jgi:hypothetical protein